jgi:hypothetical protein
VRRLTLTLIDRDRLDRPPSAAEQTYVQSLLDCLVVSRLPNLHKLPIGWDRPVGRDGDDEPTQTATALDFSPPLTVAATLDDLSLLLPSVSLNDQQLIVLSRLSHLPRLDVHYQQRSRLRLAMRWSERQLMTLFGSDHSPLGIRHFNLSRTIFTSGTVPLLQSTGGLSHLVEFDPEYIPDVTLEDGSNLADCEFLPQMSRLESAALRFSLDPLTSIFAASLAACGSHLTKLTIGYADIESSLLTTALPGLTQLTDLTLNGATFTSFIAFSSVSHLSQTLQQLTIRFDHPIPGSEVRHLLQHSGCSLDNSKLVHSHNSSTVALSAHAATSR